MYTIEIIGNNCVVTKTSDGTIEMELAAKTLTAQIYNGRAFLFLTERGFHDDGSDSEFFAKFADIESVDGAAFTEAGFLDWGRTELGKSSGAGATGPDTFGTVATATAALTTTNGVSVAIGEQYTLFPDGTTWASNTGISADPNNKLVLGTDNKPYFDPECEDVTEQFIAGATSNPGAIPPSGILLTEITVTKAQDITVVHTGTGFSGGAGSGFGIADAPLFAAANSIANANVYNSFNDRIAAGSPSKTYTVSLPAAGTYYVGVWSGGNSGVTSHTLDISYCKPILDIDTRFVEMRCYDEPVAALATLDNDPFADEINATQLATLPSGAHMRWTAPSDAVLDTLEVNGFNGTVDISWATSTGETGSQSVTFGANPQNLALGGIALATDETIDFTLDSISAGQMQLTTASTSVANGWTALQDYSGFANTSHWATRLLFADGVVKHNVNVYEDTSGETVFAEINGDDLTDLADIPVNWTPCAEETPIDLITKSIDCYEIPVYSTAYDERNATTTGTFNLGNTETQFEFYAGPTPVPFEGVVVTLTNTSASPITIFAEVEDLDTGNTLAQVSQVIQTGTAEYFFAMPGLMLGNNNAEGYDLLWNGANRNLVTMDLASPRDRSIGQLFTQQGDFKPKAAWVTSPTITTEKVNVVTLSDDTQKAYDSTGAEIPLNIASWLPCPLDISTETGNILIAGDDGKLYAMPVKSSVCYIENGISTTLDQIAEVGGNGRGVFDNAQNGTPIIRWTSTYNGSISAFEAWIGLQTNSGTNLSFTATNTTTGDSTTSNALNPLGITPNIDTFTFATPLAVSVGDVIEFSFTDANTNDWGLFNTSLDAGIEWVGSANGEAFQPQVRILGDASVERKVYEYSDGETTKLIYHDSDGLPQEITQAQIDTNLASGDWELCATDWIKEDCYEYPTTDFEFVADAITENNGNMLQSTGAVAPSSAPVRLSNAGAEPIQINSIRVRAGAVGWATLPAGNLTLNGVQYIATAYEDIDNTANDYRTIVFTPNTTPLVIQPLQTVTSFGNWGLMTGGFQGPVSSGAGTNPPFGGLTQARAEIDYVVGSPVMEKAYVRTYSDGSLKLVDRTTDTLTDLAAIDPTWTLCNEPEILNDGLAGQSLVLLPDGSYSHVYPFGYEYQYVKLAQFTNTNSIAENSILTLPLAAPLVGGSYEIELTGKMRYTTTTGEADIRLKIGNAQVGEAVNVEGKDSAADQRDPFILRDVVQIAAGQQPSIEFTAQNHTFGTTTLFMYDLLAIIKRVSD